MGGVTYDTGALVAAERNNGQMWALHPGYQAEEVIPTVPAAVLAQSWRRGSREGSLSCLLRMCDTEPMIENLAKDGGVLAGKSGHDDIVDVSVVDGRRPPLRRRSDIERNPHPDDRQGRRSQTPNRIHLACKAFPRITADSADELLYKIRHHYPGLVAARPDAASPS